ncbi:DNA-directed RNA polymerase subunit alpha C-terminal domain-containing protein, partial [Ruminococcus sp.]
VRKISSQMELPVPNVTQHRRNALRYLYNSDFSYILLYGLEGIAKRDYERAFAEGYDKGYKEGYNDGFHDYVKDRGFRERQGNAPLQSLNDLPQMLIEDMDLPPRVYHSCEFRGIRTLRELACLSPEEVFNIRNVGIKTYMIVVDILSKYGINKEPYIIEFQKHNKSDYDDTNINDKNADN